jgi:hypothetical protein
MNDEPTPAECWQQALRELTRDSESAAEWRFSRWTFAHRLGLALTGDSATGGAITGSVIYGIWLDWGLIYIGQTSEAERRLRDLPVGESHHLANTFPPEIWNRVVVLPWPELSSVQPGIERLSPSEVGLGLEYGLQLKLSPLANASRRTTNGNWRPVNWATSGSRGAQTFQQIGELFSVVKDIWDRAEAWQPGDEALPGRCHVVFPARLLP